MAIPLIDDSRFPLVFVVFPAEATERDLDTYIGRLESVYRRGRFGGVSSIDSVRRASASLRKHIAMRIDELTARYPGRVICEASFASSAFLRGAFAAYSWLKQDRSYPSRCFATSAEAVAWACELIRAAGLEVPSRSAVGT